MKKGISLAELLAVVVILSIIATISYTLVGNVISRTQAKSVVQDATVAASTLLNYCVINPDEPICQVSENIYDIKSNDIKNFTRDYISKDFQEYDIAIAKNDAIYGMVVSLLKGDYEYTVTASGAETSEIKTRVILDEDINGNSLNAEEIVSKYNSVPDGVDLLMATPSTYNESIILGRGYGSYKQINDDQLKKQNASIIIKNKTFNEPFKIYANYSYINFLDSVAQNTDLHGESLKVENSTINGYLFLWNSDNGEINDLKQKLIFNNSTIKNISMTDSTTIELLEMNVKDTTFNPNYNNTSHSLYVGIPVKNITIDYTTDFDGPLELSLALKHVFTNNHALDITKGTVINVKDNTNLSLDNTIASNLNQEASDNDCLLTIKIYDNAKVKINNHLYDKNSTAEELNNLQAVYPHIYLENDA